MIALSQLDGWRIQPPRFWNGRGGLGDDQAGAFMIKYKAGVKLKVIASAGDGWDHVSVSLENRCPSWEEMSWIARKFFGDQPAMQLHVSSADHINYHPYCLHWWRPIGVDMPLPPQWMIGPKARADQRANQVSA